MSDPTPATNTTAETSPAAAAGSPAGATAAAAASSQAQASRRGQAGNLTLDTNFVRQAKAEPLEGHTVVVLERVGESGEKFHSLLEPGDDRPRRGLIAFVLNKPSVYFAYAVDASKHRQLKFSSTVQMAERAHSFELHFSLWYRAADPQLVVASRNSDPLRLVRSKVVEVVTAEMAELPWISVWESFRVASEAVVGGTMATLRSFARDHGIAINSLELRAEFPETAVAADKRIHQIHERTRVARERLEARRELRNHQGDIRRAHAARDEEDYTYAARRGLQDVIVNETKLKVAEQIRGAGSMIEVGEVQRQLGNVPAMGLFGLSGQNGVGGQHALGPGYGNVNGNGYAPAALAPGGDSLSGVLAELVSLTGFHPEIQARQVRGALLHVIAAVVADDSTQVSGELAAWSARARMAIDGIASLPVEKAEALQTLADPEHLRSRLYPPPAQHP